MVFVAIAALIGSACNDLDVSSAPTNRAEGAWDVPPASLPGVSRIVDDLPSSSDLPADAATVPEGVPLIPAPTSIGPELVSGVVSYSMSRDRSDSLSLHAASVSGSVHIFAEFFVVAEIERVVWSIDGVLIRDDDLLAPYELVPDVAPFAGALDTARVGVGSHVLTAEAVISGGGLVLTADFEVTASVPVPTTTSVAPTTTAVAPTTTSVAPTTTVPVPTTTSVAPTTTAVAPTTTSVAPTTTVPVPTTTSVAPTTTVPATTTTTTVAISVPGVPAAGSVGYSGSESSLTVIDSAETAPAGTQWNAQYNYLDIRSAGVTLDGVHVKGGIDFYGAGTLTIRNSIVEGGYGSWMIIMLRDGAGRLELTDSTLRWRAGGSPSAGSGSGAIQVSGDHSDSLILRNDISGNPDGIQVAGDRWTIQQNWIHGLAMIGSYPNNTHNDGVQLYNGTGHRIVSNRIEIGAVSPYSNSPVFLQGSSIGSVTIQGNYLDGGGYSLYPQNGQISVVDNVFGPNHLYGPVRVGDGASVVAWTNNSSFDGSAVSAP